jgi:hypothetical protein
MPVFTGILLYIDPGTGSLLLQILAGGAIASVVFFKRIWYSITGIFRKKDPSSEKK